MIRLLFLIFFLGCSFTPDYTHIKVVKVIDGDTVKLSNGKLLRYIGLDTPEVRIKKNGRFIYSPQPFALEAKDFNRHLVEGKFVKIEFDVERSDKYGRLLGYCFVRNKFVNAKLIEEGYAVVYTRPPNVKYTDLFLSLQQKARRERKGLWGSYEVIESRNAYQYINQIRTVRGVVLSTYMSKKALYLNFGKDYRKDFTIVIFKDCYSQFSKIGIDPLTFYKGKTVEVTGRIRSYNGPEIIASSPFDIRIVK